MNIPDEYVNTTEHDPETVATYARVSTADQDASRQLDELRAWVADQYPAPRQRSTSTSSPA